MGTKIFILISLLTSLNAYGRPTPVYLEPNNPAPTGHFRLEQLKDKAIAYDQFEWLWVRDSFGHSGWVLKSSVMLPLDFSRRAVLSQGEDVFAKPQSYDLPQRKILKSQVVTLVHRHRDWFQVMYKYGNDTLKGWVRARYLRPYSKDPGLFFLTQETPLRKEPKSKTKILETINPGEPMAPLRLLNGWAYVQVGNKKGYVPLQNIRSRIDIAMKVRTPEGYYKPHPSLINKKVLEIYSNPLWVGTGGYSIELKSTPDMGSNTVTTIEPWQTMTLQGYSIKRWGLSQIPKWGQLWWPDQTIESNIELIENFKPQAQTLKRSEVYQVQVSPTVPGLRFASTANGVFRSFDGKNWHPLPDFKNGYPLRMAKNGTLFVGDKVSFDQGESFHDYIRWDRVLSSIPLEGKLGHGPIQILNVEPNDNDYKKVTLSLKFGANKIMQIYTSDLGQSWRPL